ncbi:MAG: hypothetical protein R3326_05860 [Gemmatimonadota bacterium]|nr:hypothetical protein [Gemmatimonadota bacterium]
MPDRATSPALTGALLVLALPIALAFPGESSAQGVHTVVPAAETQTVRQAAFTLWWPEFERLMREFRHNTPSDAGRIALPEPSPDGFFREIEILGRIPHPATDAVSLYSVTTEGELFQALFVLGDADRAWPLVNRVDPTAFREEMSHAYVEATNALLERHGVEPASAEEALALARFTVEVFYNFDYRYQPGSVDSLTFAELNRVRVLRSTDDIPQGLRRFDTEKGNALMYGKVPERIRGTVTPPNVQTLGPDDFMVSFYSWHPQSGELKRWEIHLADGQFASLKDQTVEKWVSFTVESF